jgi:hypothetical protein
MTTTKIVLKPLTDVYRPAFEELLREAWQRNWSNTIAAQIVQWRYYNRPAGAVTWLAIDSDGMCVGSLDSVVRPYLVNGRRVMVRETADWYCMPHCRRFGVGFLLMRKVCECPESIFVLGGSAYTLQILPKLRWTALPSATGFVLPVRARGLASNLIRQRWWQQEAWARLVPNFLPAKSPRRIDPPTGRRGRSEILAHDKPLMLPASVGDGLVQLFEQEHWAWLGQMPSALAKPLGVTFFLDDVLAGFSLSQIEPTASGLDAKIIYLHSTDPALIGWVISETARLLADLDVGFIRCCVSTVEKIAALQQVGFIKTRDVPCHWSPGNPLLSNHIDVGYLRGDDAIPFQALRGRRLDD